MAISIKELIEKLAQKDQDAQVEFIVVTTAGEAVTMDVQKNAKSMASLLKMFRSAK